jgi:hypothetical protein
MFIMFFTIELKNITEKVSLVVLHGLATIEGSKANRVSSKLIGFTGELGARLRIQADNCYFQKLLSCTSEL